MTADAHQFRQKFRNSQNHLCVPAAYNSTDISRSDYKQLLTTVS